MLRYMIVIGDDSICQSNTVIASYNCTLRIRFEGVVKQRHTYFAYTIVLGNDSDSCSSSES